MTQYQHPAEKGSIAEDFLGSHNPYPLYQYSVFLNGGRDEQLVVRAATFSELLAGKHNINKVLDKVSTHNGVEHNNGQINGKSNGQVECGHHDTRIFTVKKDGPNKGREFKSCTHCKAFLGFA
jgi:hypothetical protein